MPVYLRKPVAVKAMQWAEGQQHPSVYVEQCDNGVRLYHLVTEWGRQQIFPGDWLVEYGRQVWVVEQDAFDRLYELARSDEAQDTTTHFVKQAQQQASQMLDELLSQNKRELRALERLVPLIGLLGVIMKMEEQVTQLSHLGASVFHSKKDRLKFLESLWDDTRARIEAIWEDETARAEREGHV